MKKLFTTMLISASMPCFSQVIPNASFENWAQAGPFLAPIDWATSPSVLQSTDAYSGSFSVLLQVDTFTNPQTSTLDTIAPSIYTGAQTMGPPPPPGTSFGGYAFTDRPTSISGWLKMNAVNGDVAMLDVQLSKWNTTSNTRDIIGSVQQQNNISVATYTPFSFPINYTSSAVPDTAFIQISLGNPQQRSMGSQLWVDDLAFSTTFSAAIQNTASQQVWQVYPNPANNLLHITSNNQNYTATLINSIGQVVLQTNSASADVSHLPNGNYCLQLRTNHQTNYQNITINHN